MGIKEDAIYEGGPHVGDLIFNILIGFTIIGLPLTIGSVIRAIWSRYRITSRRISTTGGWMGRNRTDVIYSEMAQVVVVPRGLGAWGDMVITLKDGSRLEMRSLPRFRELYDYINEKISRKGQTKSGSGSKVNA
ncbi:PH domain-containing protein [Roseofilum sp. BLCC_M154]|uniref:PH domain-containing protein n=1 Tax=Roseofilum acuticapitatum BLCC-M154 TaxID=3022444 RepID=A0ABT7AU22_9CYAN|nr:PH domain-containing protein [Roseofilum acuticapitatum]MDJ1169821.1 PH domain-containing protein [Roseofilum acuticapitatum BLCC-M154]